LGRCTSMGYSVCRNSDSKSADRIPSRMKAKGLYL
jgi:hypothetical protein